MINALDHILYQEQLREQELFSSEMRRAQGDQIDVHTQLQGRCKQDGVRFFPVSSNRTGGQIETQKALSEHKEHRQRFSRDIAEYPS